LYIDQNGENPFIAVAAGVGALEWALVGMGVISTGIIYQVSRNGSSSFMGIKGTNLRGKDPLAGTTTSRGQPSSMEGGNRNNDSNGNNLSPKGKLIFGVVSVLSGVTSWNKFVKDAMSSNGKDASGSESMISQGETDDNSTELSEIDSVCGEHLSKTDPDYWNDDLSNKQRNGYNKRRNTRFQEYQRKKSDEENEDVNEKN